MAQFYRGPDHLIGNSSKIFRDGGHRLSQAKSPGVLSKFEYQEAYSFRREEVEPQSKKMPDELKKRVEAAAKEFNFTMADIDVVEKALRDQNSKSNLFQDDVKIRVAAAIEKYKFTPEEIAIVQKAVRDEKSSKASRGSANVGGFDGNGAAANCFSGSGATGGAIWGGGFSGYPVSCGGSGPYCRGELEVKCNIL